MKIQNYINKTLKKLDKRKITLLMTDIILINLATLISILLRYDGAIHQAEIRTNLHFFILATLIKIMVYYLFHLYKSLWQYAGLEELLQIFFATTIGTIATYITTYPMDFSLSKSIILISYILTMIFVGASRLSYRVLRRLKGSNIISTNGKTKIMVVGAGSTGASIIKEIKKYQKFNATVVLAIDDDPNKQGAYISGVQVKGDRTQIVALAEKYDIDEIIIAIPSATNKEIQKILELCKYTRCRLKKLPTFKELISGEIAINQIRDVHIEDLLGRQPISLNVEEISGYIKDKTVLVTGGGGSIGSELCRQITKFSPKKLLILEIYENNAYVLQKKLENIYKKNLDLEVIIGSIQDKKRLEDVFNRYKPQVIFHAAAHKHVPLMESNPTEAIKNNIIGTKNVAECADKHKSETFVLISTDKAVNPTNIMGATKRTAEMIIQDLSKISKTKYVAVRFGNVLGSNGSVVPLFQSQIGLGGPLTVTHPEITRFFMTIDEAAQLVIQAGAMAKGGEIFILDMGQPVKVINLAKDLIRLSGLEPDIDIKIQYTGLRPGEKLYEELMMKEEGISATKHDKIFISKPIEMDSEQLKRKLKELMEKKDSDNKSICIIMQKLVPTYKCEYAQEEQLEGQVSVSQISIQQTKTETGKVIEAPAN